MVEVTRSRPILIRCLAKPAALDALVSGCTFAGRVALDEMLLWYSASEADALDILNAIAAELGRLDPDSLTVDHTGAFAVFTLSGDAHAALSRLTANPIPAAGFAQGLVAGAPAKIIVAPECIHILVSSTLAHSVRTRLLSACAGLAAIECAATPRLAVGQRSEP